jgi:hypothetical protein
MFIHVKKSGSEFTDSNIVNVVKINNLQLPEDVTIAINGDKLIAESQILDGVSVFERITRKPYDISFEFTIRDKTTIQNSNSIFGVNYKNPSQTSYIFPLSKIIDYFQQVWQPDQVVSVKNNLINGMGIFQLVIRTIKYTTTRGSVNVPVTLNCSEDYYSTKDQGSTLLI